MGIKDFLTKIFSFKKKESELLKMLRYALKIEEEKISEAQAYELVEWIYTCIKVIAQRVAGLPFYIYDKEGKEVYDEPYKVLKTPNPLMTGYSLFEGTVSWLYLKGFAVWYYNKNEKTLWLLPSDQVKIEIGEFKTINNIIVKFGNEKYKFTDLIFFNFWNYKYPNSYWEGISPVQVLMNILQIEQKINKHHAIILDTLMNVKGFLTSEQPLTDEQRKSLEDSLRVKLMGYEKGAMIGILPQGFKFQPVDVKSEDASFVSLKKLNREAIAAALGVPPAIVGIFEYANYANVKEQLRLFWEYTGIPLCERIANVINSFFLPKYFGEYTFEFDYLSVPTLAETKREIMDTYARLVSSGIITINEAREEQGYKKVPWGNSWWGPMTLVPLATLVEEEGKVLKELKEKQAFSKRRILKKEERKMLWDGYDKILTAYEKIMRRQIKQFFNEQLKTIKEKIKQYFLSLEKEFDIKSLNAKKIVREIYDIDYWQNRFLALTRALIYDIIKTGGERALAMVLEGKKQEDYVLNMSRVEVYRWLEEWAGRRVRSIQETTRDRLIEVIEEGIKKGVEEGESIVQIEKRIEKMIENDFALSVPKRLEYIVRTETLGAMNFGHICGYEQSGVVEGKEWLATMDERVRDAHAEADGQIVGMDEPFIVGGEALEYPGDPAGSPENVINCRCTVLPVLKEEF
jgi:HK97 family phage portal protein